MLRSEARMRTWDDSLVVPGDEPGSGLLYYEYKDTHDIDSLSGLVLIL